MLESNVVERKWIHISNECPLANGDDVFEQVLNLIDSQAEDVVNETVANLLQSFDLREDEIELLMSDPKSDSAELILKMLRKAR